ncbi:hypothetical protein [Dactylosporangium matsuzakiense]|uniref:Secreted protein n=1 Tax=Dactylosporangium matsuzakiense TaxID=53360 RepID=A0A9W6KVR5_9ACTN|nr:hypothetical protein [Dactylosporangium matsuzakiense]UWZ42429.1 hypothetical protein Dmats_33355 [Dactylosporangium matsuzakiense]GLL08070.1 hypothetical protein GCM10017581_098300 [Dactylosporangium matsuzakiense]
MSTIDTPTNPWRKRLLIGGGAAAVLSIGLGLGVAGAQTNTGASGSPGNIVCPTVSDRLPAVPVEARAEVERNLQLLNTQVAEANQRLVTSQGQGGPNFVNNAILGPLKDKRVSTIDRIAIAIGRHAAKPTGLDSLAGCRLVKGQPPATAVVPAPVVTKTTTATRTTAPPAGNPGGGNQGGGTIACPSVADKLPAIPAQAQEEVDRNLTLLQTQIAEAEQRLATSQGQGGPNFVNNAILGPLKDKRVATINRIATAIGRHAARPEGLAESLSTCALA